MRTNFSAAVIAGGAGRRMGFDKRLLLVDGVPLVVRAVAAVAPLASEVLVAVSRDHPLPGRLLPDPRVRIVVDRVAGGGPLAGIEAALLEAQHDLVLVVAGDLPWLQPKLLRLLVEFAEANPDAAAVTIASTRGLEPMLAVYRSAALAVATTLLNAGERRLGRLLEELPTTALGEDEWRTADPDGRSLVNLNEPSDLAH